MYRKKEDYLDYQKRYSASHKEEANLRMRRWNKKTRLALLALLGNKCIKCGIDDYRVLQIDHINGGGTKEYDDVKTGTKKANYNRFLIKKILDGSAEYQILCSNCNWIKRHENQEYFKL